MEREGEGEGESEGGGEGGKRGEDSKVEGAKKERNRGQESER